MKTALILLLLVTVIALAIHPKKKGQRHRVEYLAIPAGAFKAGTKGAVNVAGTAAEYGAKVSDESINSFTKAFDDMLSGGKTLDNITGTDVATIAKELDAFKDVAGKVDWDDFAKALKVTYNEDAFKVFDDFLVDTRRLDDIGTVPEATQVKIFEDVEKRLSVKYANSGDRQLFNTWNEIAMMRKGPNTLLSDLKNADIAKTIDEYVALRKAPLEEGTNLQVLRKSLDDPAAWKRWVNAPWVGKIVTGSFFAGMVASILVGIFVKPSYYDDKGSGDSGYNPYTGECASGDLECTAAQWMDWLNENMTMVGLASCASVCLCVCCCCMLSIALVMDGENQNAFF